MESEKENAENRLGLSYIHTTLEIMRDEGSHNKFHSD